MYDDEDKPPVLEAYWRPIYYLFTDEIVPNTWGLAVWCKYCTRWHMHGQGVGHRVAHCHGLTSLCGSYTSPTPYQETGYILMPNSKYLPEDWLDMEKPDHFEWLCNALDAAGDTLKARLIAGKV